MATVIPPVTSYFIVYMTENAKLCFFLVIILSHLAFAIYWLIYFLGEFRATVRKRFPRIYLALFLCFRKEQLELELEVDQYK